MAGKRYRTVGRLLYACGACSEQSERFDRYPNNPEGRMRALRAAFRTRHQGWLLGRIGMDLADRVGPAFATPRSLDGYECCSGECSFCASEIARLTPRRTTPAERAALVEETYAALRECVVLVGRV